METWKLGNSPLWLNHGLMAGWLWKSWGYWCIVSLSKCWWCCWFDDESRSSFWCLIGDEVSSEDCDSVEISCWLAGDDVRRCFRDDRSILSEFSQLFCCSSSLASSDSIARSFFGFLSLLSSKISQMWNPDEVFVVVGNFILSRKLWVKRIK